MARLALSLTLLVFLVTVKYASMFHPPENDITDRDLSVSLPESDANPSLLLPSETKPLDIDAKAVGATQDLPVPEAKPLVANRPLTIVRFRPINRRSHIPLRVRRGCRHGIKPMMMNPRVRGREVSYGDDMILAGESKDFHPKMFRGGVRHIPTRWVRFHQRQKPAFPFSKQHEMFAEQSFRRPFRREEVKEKEEKREEGGFMKKFREFMNQF